MNASRVLAKMPGYRLTVNDLEDICSFDKRNESSQIDILNGTYQGVQGVAGMLQSDAKNGLPLKAPQGRTEVKKGQKNKPVVRDSRISDEEERRDAFGENIIPPPPSETILQLIVGTIMDDPILKVLIVGAVVVLGLGTATCPSTGWTEGLAIVIAVFIVLGVTAGNDYSKDRKFKKLMLLQTDKKCRVIRSGQKFEISSWDLFVGDVVELVVGDEVPADGIYIDGNGLVVDESPLTGETVPVKKNAKSPFCFSGCQVSEGVGTMLVTGVGVHSSGGKIQELLNDAQNEMTPLQEKLKDVAILIGKLGVAAGIVTFIGLAVRWGISFATNQQLYNSCGNEPLGGSTIARLGALAEDFVVAITIVVVAVPEGLPLAVTLALSLSMFKMMRDRCFVRHLDASETMGQATTVCTDKTGTLTYNRMSVVRLMVKDKIFKGEGSGDKDAVPFSSRTLNPFMKSVLSEACCINSNCFIKNEELVDDAGATPIFVGSATEGAMLILCKKFGVHYSEVRKQKPVIPNGVWSFSAERKRMSSMVQHEGLYRLYTKGASEIVLGLCTSILDPESEQAVPLDHEQVSHVQHLIKQWASEGLRTIAVAYRDYEQPLEVGDSSPEQDLVFIGLMAIKDPLRKEIPLAVATCQKAGIIVRMVTGDNVLTATKIAKEANIFHGDGIALEGPVFRKMTREEKVQVVPRLQVLARCSPSDKFELVSLLQELGEVVAVTGDGTNDAPALKQADIGFSMGISGTQVAMNASDIVLLDDNFASIVSATKWGRNVLTTIRKFLQFQLGINCAAVICTFIGSISTGHSPLSTIQLLLINLIMDSFGALALASDEPEADILLQKPQRKTDAVITPLMWEYIGLQTVFQTAVVLLLLFGSDSWIPADMSFHSALDVANYPSKRATSLVFGAFILIQLTNLICSRSLNGELNMFTRFFANRTFLGVLMIIAVILVLAITVFYDAFNVCRLSGVEWLICILIALANIPLVFLFRLASKIYHSREKTSGKVSNLNTSYERLIRNSTVEDHVSIPVDGKPASRRSSYVEQIRKFKTDAPMPTKTKSKDSLNKLE
ncbi:hypothetical protein EDD86DRAFT_227293 [Gorgonomyces haynaldii]|nr:hypothetical protein EDD86DRAFT_227293 [Gorgonomyces haynaldii]